MRKKQSIKELKDEGLVKNASELPIVGNKGIWAQIKDNPVMDYEESKDKFNAMFLIGMEITKYCELASITPQDLISSHKELNKPNLSSKKGKELKISDVGKDKKSEKPTQSNFRAELIKKKTGYSK